MDLCKCSKCEYQIDMEMKDYLYYQDKSGSRHRINEFYSVPEEFIDEYSEDLINFHGVQRTLKLREIFFQNTGFNHLCFCLNCNRSFNADIGRNPYITNTYGENRDLRKCESCSSNNVKTELELGNRCPNCGIGHFPLLNESKVLSELKKKYFKVPSKEYPPLQIEKFLEQSIVKEEAMILAELERKTQINLDLKKEDDVLWDIDECFGYKINNTGNIKSLALYHLEDQYLDDFPEKICEMTFLEELHLVNHEFTLIPEEISQLKNLKVLNLTLNLIKKLPESIGNLKMLEELELQGNLLENIPSSIKNLKFLRRLILGNIYFGGNNLIHFPEEIGELSALQELNIECNKLT